jgi:hypothetical protein
MKGIFHSLGLAIEPDEHKGADAFEFVQAYVSQMTGGKRRLRPNE